MASPDITNSGFRRSLAILVADDDVATVSALSEMLRRDTHTVHAVTRGDRVLEEVRRINPDVCIVSIEVPGQSGYAIAQLLTTGLGQKRPLLIALSRLWTRSSEQHLAHTLGFHYFFSKEQDLNELMPVVRWWARRPVV